MPQPQPKIDLSAGVVDAHPQIDLSAGLDSQVHDAPAAPTRIMSAPTEQPSWIDQAEQDLREGGNRTIVGRGLGFLQGRGGKGFVGLGEGPMGADALPASLLMGTVHSYQGMRHGDPLQYAKGLWEQAQLPLAFAAGPESNELVEAIPSRANAARILNDIGSKAQEVPVFMRRTEPALGEFEQHVATGGKNAEVMGKLRTRLESPEQGPVHFPEARQFYTNVTDVTKRPGVFARMLEDAREPRMRMAAGPVRNALHEDLTESLKPIGEDQRYQGAIDEYRKAARNVSMAKKAGYAAAPAAAGALGGKKLYGFLRGVL